MIQTKGLNDVCVKELLDFARALLPLPPGAGNIASVLPNSSKAFENPQAIFIHLGSTSEVVVRMVEQLEPVGVVLAS